LDIRDGLKWVHENIEAFGGDPGNVMIFGENGGDCENLVPLRHALGRALLQ
jgi:carboxylesterase type B